MDKTTDDETTDLTQALWRRLMDWPHLASREDATGLDAMSHDRMLALALAQGVISIPASGRTGATVEASGEPIGLLRRALMNRMDRWSCTATHERINTTDEDRQALCLALLDHGVEPLNADDHLTVTLDAVRLGMDRLLARLLPGVDLERLRQALAETTDGRRRSQELGALPQAFLVAWRGHTTCLKQLVERGVVDVNVRSERGATLAAIAQHPETITALAAMGLDPSLEDQRRRRASDLWQSLGGNAGTMTLLKKAWNAAFPIDKKDPLERARQERATVTEVAHKAGSILAQELKAIGHRPGGLVQGQTLMTWAARSLASGKTPKGLSKTTGKTVELVTGDNTWNRLNEDGLSDAWCLAMAGLMHGKPQLWREACDRGLMLAPESTLALDEQLQAVERFFETMGVDESVRPLARKTLNDELWDRNVRRDVGLGNLPQGALEFLSGDQDGRPRAFEPPVSGSTLKLFLNALGRNESYRDDALEAMPAERWMAVLLWALPDLIFYSRTNDYTLRHGLPYAPNASTAPTLGAVRWLSDLWDQGVLPDPLGVQALGLDGLQNRLADRTFGEAADAVAALVEAALLNQATPSTPGRSRPHARL